MTGSREPSDTPLDLAAYWRMALKHRLVILGSLIAAILIGVAATLLMTPIYTAATTVQIDREAARVFDVEDVNPRESMIQGEEFFQTQYGLIRSRSLAERVIDSLGLARSDAFLNAMNVEPPRATGTAANQARLRREAVIRTVQANLGVSPVRGSRLAVIEFDSPDPALSARVANAFAENFIQANLDRKFDSSQYARRFLEERIAQTRARLEDAERELVAYATSQQIINLSEGGEANDRTQSLASNNLSTLNAALAEARAERVAAEEKWRQARVSGLMTLPEVLQNPAIQRLSEEKAQLNAEYQQKLRLYKEDFPEMVQLRAQIDEADQQIRAIATNIRSSIQQQYTVAANQERSLQSQVSALTSDVLNLRERSIQYNILQREVDTSRTLYDGLLQRYKEVGVTGGVTANNISIIDTAKQPTRPSKPNLMLNLVLSVLLGLGLGAVLAFILEALDETLATPDDVENKLGLPVLGVIPMLDKTTTAREAIKNPRSAFAEAYASLRTALQFSTPNGAPQTLLVTSARPAEGKSTTALAVGQSLAQIGRSVLLIDGDLRNPSMHRTLNASNDAGMTNLLSGAASLSSLARQTDVQNLAFIPSGPLPPNPAELWGSDRLNRVLAEAREMFDHVVIDGPPVLGLADAPLLANAMAGTVFVLESRGTRRGQARGALRRLGIGGVVLGIVLTKFDAKSANYGAYDYSYDYDYGPGSTGKKGR